VGQVEVLVRDSSLPLGFIALLSGGIALILYFRPLTLYNGSCLLLSMERLRGERRRR